MKIKNKLSFYGIIILIVLNIAFYFIASFFLDRIKPENKVDEEVPSISQVDKDYQKEKDIVLKSYNKVRLIYDVVNSQFKVSSDEPIIINDKVYKKITNFNDITNGLFTENGINKYISDFSTYFVNVNDDYYLASNLTNYQTYYFRGDNTSIYVVDSMEEEIKAIIYEKWTSNNKTTLAAIKLLKVEENWLIDNISILNHN